MVAHFFWMKECPLHDMKLLQIQPVLKDTRLYLKHIGFGSWPESWAITEHHGIRIVPYRNQLRYIYGGGINWMINV